MFGGNEDVWLVFDLMMVIIWYGSYIGLLGWFVIFLLGLFLFDNVVVDIIMMWLVGCDVVVNLGN